MSLDGIPPESVVFEAVVNETSLKSSAFFYTMELQLAVTFFSIKAFH